MPVAGFVAVAADFRNVPQEAEEEVSGYQEEVVEASGYQEVVVEDQAGQDLEVVVEVVAAL